METSVRQNTVAYFSMEIALDARMPTYSGGLGVLAGDTLRAAADLGIPVVAVSLLYHKGYFNQRLDADGNQIEAAAQWSPEEFLTPMEPRVAVTIEGRQVLIRAWRYSIQGASGEVVPVYLLDAALEANSPRDQGLTDYLYGGDQRYRLCQETILGMGGFAMLQALGHSVQTYHMNEGHSVLLVLGLLAQRLRSEQVKSLSNQEHEAIRKKCVFTTHTPVPAGHDVFPIELVRRVLGEETSESLVRIGCLNQSLNMTFLALFFSHYVNGVAMRHGEISHGMFPNYPINSITNGVHGATWTSEPFQRLYDRHFPQWRVDNLNLRYAVGISVREILDAHAEAKRSLLMEVEKRSGVSLDLACLTMGFARRAATYKRLDLLFADLDRLRRISQQVGNVQVLYAGKAHPRDEGGKAMIRRVFAAAKALGDAVRVLYLPDYDMKLAHLLTSGVDLWLNTPQKPQEASGTSGMKAALNGVPSLSILDGWWIEGCFEGVTGWAIGTDSGQPSDPVAEATSLYDKLEYVILPLFYHRPFAYAEVMRSAIALNASFFNAERMVDQYEQNAYQTLWPAADSAETAPAQPGG